MAQDDRALEGEGVGGVSNGQAGLCGQCETTQEAEIPGSASMPLFAQDPHLATKSRCTTRSVGKQYKTVGIGGSQGLSRASPQAMLRSMRDKK